MRGDQFPLSDVSEMIAKPLPDFDCWCTKYYHPPPLCTRPPTALFLLLPCNLVISLLQSHLSSSRLPPFIPHIASQRACLPSCFPLPTPSTPVESASYSSILFGIFCFFHAALSHYIQRSLQHAPASAFYGVNEAALKLWWSLVERTKHQTGFSNL